MIFASTLTVGCKERVEVGVVSTSKQVSSFDFSKIAISSHVSYIPLNLSGYPHENREVIIQVFEEFRKKYPSLDIRSQQIEYQPLDHSVPSATLGIWVFHEPKKE